MAELPTDKERDARIGLADALDRRRTVILQRFREGLEPARRRGDRPLLIDVIPDLLARFAQELRGRAAVSSVGTAAWRELAQEHALTSVRDGFDLEKLLQELAALRRATVEGLAEGSSVRQ